MEENLPLAEVQAKITAFRYAKNFTLTLHVWEDGEKQQMCDLALGPSGDRVVLVTFRQVPPDWERGPVDPNQSDEEINVVAKLEDEWRSLQARMTADADIQP